VKSHNTSKITGQKPFINTNVYDPATGNWLSEMIEPASMPWSMVIGKAMYASSDQGKSWKKIRDTDEQHSPEAVRKAIEDNMKTAKNAKCGFEDLDGIRHETLEAEYTAQGNIAVQDKHWIHPETRRTVKSWSLMKQAGFETETTQVIEYLESYTFPTP
jgi:hypothetical protein